MWPLENLKLRMCLTCVACPIFLLDSTGLDYHSSTLLQKKKIHPVPLRLFLSPLLNVSTLPPVPASSWMLHPCSTRTFFFYSTLASSKAACSANNLLPVYCSASTIGLLGPSSFYFPQSIILTSLPILVPFPSCPKHSCQFFKLHWPLSFAWQNPHLPSAALCFLSAQTWASALQQNSYSRHSPKQQSPLFPGYIQGHRIQEGSPYCQFYCFSCKFTLPYSTMTKTSSLQSLWTSKFLLILSR